MAVHVYICKRRNGRKCTREQTTHAHRKTEQTNDTNRMQSNIVGINNYSVEMLRKPIVLCRKK